MTFAARRRTRHEHLHVRQFELERKHRPPSTKACSICGEVRFETAEFFRRSSTRDAAGQRSYSFGECVTCDAELGVLTRQGHTRE